MTKLIELTCLSQIKELDLEQVTPLRAAWTEAKSANETAGILFHARIIHDSIIAHEEDEKLKSKYRKATHFMHDKRKSNAEDSYIHAFAFYAPKQFPAPKRERIPMPQRPFGV